MPHDIGMSKINLLLECCASDDLWRIYSSVIIDMSYLKENELK